MRNERSDSLDSLREELRNENPETLLNRLEARMESEEIDVDEISLILDVLDEVAPMQMPVQSPEESLQEFWKKCGPILDAESKKRTAKPIGRRILNVAVAACLCVVMLGIVAQASGIDLIGWFLEWHEETFVFHGQGGGQMVLESVPEGEYASAEEAVAAYGITDPVVPKWIPARFGIQNVQAKELSNGVNITARYVSDNEQKVVLKIYLSRDDIILGDGQPDVHSEHSNFTQKPDCHEKNGVVFFLTNNNSQLRATWETGVCTCSINGDLSKDEIIQMIDSIFLEEG